MLDSYFRELKLRENLGKAKFPHILCYLPARVRVQPRTLGFIVCSTTGQGAPGKNQSGDGEIKVATVKETACS